MALGNLGSQQHDHDAICAHMALHGVKLSRGIMGMNQFLGIDYRNGLIGMKK